MAQVVLSSVNKRFSGHVAAVTDLNLTVEDQEFLVLVGPSGCGKTTTLRMIAGLEETTSGLVTIGDRNVTHVSPKDRDIAMVFQNYALYPHMSVRRNMSFGLELRYGGNIISRAWRNWRDPQGAKHREEQRIKIPQEVDRVGNVLGIGHLLDRYPRELSGGERQRVALGRAIVRQPAAFLFDEPLSNLDAKLRVEMRRELKELHRRLGATMIYVTHDQVEAMTLGDKIAVMNQGTLQQVGTPEEVYRYPRNQFVAGFLGSPGMNLVTGKLESQSNQQAFRGDGIELDANHLSVPEISKSMVLGIRPEHLKINAEGQSSDESATWRQLGQGKIELIESLGDVQYVHIEMDGKTSSKFTAKTNPVHRFSMGDRCTVAASIEDLHWFDAESGERLVASD